MVMKHYYEKTREINLDIIETGNFEQINELLDDIQTGFDKRQFTDMEVTYITEDTNQL